MCFLPPCASFFYKYYRPLRTTRNWNLWTGWGFRQQNSIFITEFTLFYQRNKVRPNGFISISELENTLRWFLHMLIWIQRSALYIKIQINMNLQIRKQSLAFVLNIYRVTQETCTSEGLWSRDSNIHRLNPYVCTAKFCSFREIIIFFLFYFQIFKNCRRF